jgi:hypothetical protein
MNEAPALSDHADALADFEQISQQAASGGIVRDPGLLKRVYERSAKVRDDARAKFGIQDIGVAIIREMRERE